MYTETWVGLIGTTLAIRPYERRTRLSLSLKTFCAFWKQDIPELRIASSGLDFCDTCTKLRSDLLVLIVSAKEYTATMSRLNRHRRRVAVNIGRYKKLQRICMRPEEDVPLLYLNFRHSVIDYAEKVLVPSLLR